MATMSGIPSRSVKRKVGDSVPGFKGMWQPSEMSDDLGQRLKQMRKSRNLTQMEVAVAIDYSRTALSGVESGNDKPGRDLLETLARFYGVTVGELYRPRSPQIGEFVEDPDELAWLIFWRGLDEQGKRLALLLLSEGRPVP